MSGKVEFEIGFTKPQPHRKAVRSERRPARILILGNFSGRRSGEAGATRISKRTLHGLDIDSLESVKNFELVKVTGSFSGEDPYRYVGIMHLTGLDDFMQKDAPSEKFQAFLAKWMPMAADAQILFAEELY